MDLEFFGLSIPTGRFYLFVPTEHSVTRVPSRNDLNPKFSPEARLIWKYAAPKPSKAVLTGLGSFYPLFEFAKRTSLYESPISLAYSENAMGGAFIPGMEIKIKTLGNQSDDYTYVLDHFLQIFEYEVTYRLIY
jgi:hypothetical protein